MANPNTSYFYSTGDSAIDTMTNGYKWSLDSSRTVDFSVSNGFAGEYWFNPGSVAQTFSNVLNTITPYANIKFNYVGAFVDPLQAANAGSEMNLSLSESTAFFPSTSIWAMGLPPNANVDTGYYSGLAGDIYLNINSQANYLPSYDAGSAGWALLMHEIGHTLGLKHPHDDGGTGRATFSQLGLDRLDLDVFTVMSYEDDANWNLITQDPATPMILDVLALQALYGKNQSTYAGNSAHYITNTGNYSTIWDASGIDVINASNASEGWVIQLPTDAWSTVVDTKVGAAVPVSQFSSASPTTFKWLAGDFENAVGSNYGDVITANQFDNNVFGGGGDDFIDGGLGVDVAFYQGSLSQYVGSISAGVIKDTVLGRDGTDTLANIERLQFTDGNLALDTGANENAGNAYLLYQAAFDRTPDEEGLGYWIGKVDDGANIVKDVAQNFILSNEFQGMYGANTTATQFTNLLYQNVLHRAPDADGLNYWLTEFASHGDSLAYRAATLNNFAISAENIANVADQIVDGIQYQAYVG